MSASLLLPGVEAEHVAHVVPAGETQALFGARQQTEAVRLHSVTDLPQTPGGWPVILADVPWTFKTYSDKGKGRSAEQHYNCMSLADIKALPVADIAAPDCALFLWATDPMLPTALDVMRAWGFTYKTVGFYWAKTTGPDVEHLTARQMRKRGYFPQAGGIQHLVPRWAIGCGYWTRSNPEQCLFGTRGKPKRLARNVRKLIVAPRREHSRKPDEAAAGIERLIAGPRLELFARCCRPGWTCWGLETDRFQVAA